MQHNVHQGGQRQARRAERGDCRVYVGNLDPAWCEADLHAAMSRCGHVLQATVCRNSYGLTKQYGFVTFARPDDASSSYGLLQFKNRVLEVKACIRKNDKVLGSPRIATNFNTPIQKENVGTYAHYQQTGNKIDPTHNLKSNPVKLNKNSKNFDKFPTLTDDQTTIESDSGKIAISIIKLSNYRSSKGEEAISHSSSSSGKGNSKISKPLSEKTGISRLSKEFFPSRPPTFTSSLGNTDQIPQGGQYEPMMNPYTVFQPGYGRSATEVNICEKDISAKPRSATLTAPKISFFTFPGRD